MARSRRAPSALPAALEDYARKRDFKATPEPGAQGAEALPDGALRFVIQKHWATRLHYDLRLEIDGTMKSWAVPKGPSFDPADKRMAVQVEDHPIAYNQFEGQIPAKQYGAGRVIIWDKGYWVPLEDPARAYRAGKLKFEIHGHKLRGRWTLVRMHGRGNERQPPWLLIKERDGQDRPAAEYSVVDAMPDSVKALPDLPVPASSDAEGARHRAPRAPAGKAAGARPTGARRRRVDGGSLPQALSPQLATLVDGPPGNLADWLFELKFDGYRILARIEGGQVRLITRNGNDWTHRMPQLADAVAALPVESGWIDGEIVVLDRHGIPDFQALQNAFESTRGVTSRRAAKAAGRPAGAEVGGLIFYVFDLPYFNGHDLRGVPLRERRDALRTLVAAGESDTVRFSEAFEAAPDQLIASACQLGFEGVIGKRASATYAEGRSADWIKLKCGQRQEFVIGGYTDPQGARTGIGSLLLGVHGDDGLLHYVGNVGSGFSERTLKTLHAQLKALGASDSPFAEGTRVGRKAHWVVPCLLAEVAFAGWTHTRHIRHAVFRGLREDKPPQDIVQETPASADAIAAAPPPAPPAPPRMTARKKSPPAPQPARPPAGRAAASGPSPSLRVTHAERVIDADSGLTKLDLVRYYALVAPLMMEHLRQRPVSVVRAPEGVGHELFFQRHQEQGSVEGIRLLDRALYPDHPALMEVAAPEGLPASAQMNAIEFHTWNARSDRIARPDRMTFDLDPGEGVGWEKIQEATTLMRVMLTELGLPAFLKTSGGKGLHVVVPIKRLHGWDTVKGFSQAVVQHMARTIPHLFVAKSGPRNRVGKIFVDYLRNGFGATTVCAWSARARPGLGISVPLAWSELETLSGSAQWTVRSVGDRLREGNAPWDGYAGAAVSITQAMRLLEYEPPRG
ncbi:DNA ligase D [Paracidovorax konjaci]|uniref:DNA ligase (ATP) n=1 Tax=Paracidovorax konjaci TaxID=32040 RepID=A0A1I1WF36_9BURK|nr:DNA ligase D [Paracidovorax konjaci]SFD93784.1 ATP-dependent DNA ligase LigD phosphoesterase module /ATP-dependent DNA ligase LigD polymerase module [Paracidovorax konjaci]